MPYFFTLYEIVKAIWVSINYSVLDLECELHDMEKNT